MLRENLSEIYALNQRGGRELSLLDLVEANTVDLPVAALLAGAVASGATFLTAARPGNAGKTTVMAALLAFLPPGRRLLTIRDPALLDHVSQETCLLAHEIGAGHYFGYLWGGDARRFFEAAVKPGVSAASNLHADTLEELRGILCGPSVGMSAETFSGIDLVAFLRMERTFTSIRRRVCAVYAATGVPGPESHRRICRWDEATDSFEVEHVPERWAAAAARVATFLEDARRQGITRFEDVAERWSRSL